MKKVRVGILFGGRSGEHEVSLLSAASVFEAIDKSKYEVVPIGITKEGKWVTAGDAARLLQGKAGEDRSAQVLRAGDPEATAGAAVLARGEGVVVPPEPQHGGLTPFQTEAGSSTPGATCVGSGDQCGRDLSRAARHIWRGWNDSGIAGIGGHCRMWVRELWGPLREWIKT